MRKIGQANQHAASLHWLAFLLTGNREQSVDIAADTTDASGSANPFFESWMVAWSRRVAIAKALTTIRNELAASARTFTAYAGTYTCGVDEIVHHLDVCSFENDRTADYVRGARLEDGQLTLETPRQQTPTGVRSMSLVWERIPATT